MRVLFSQIARTYMRDETLSTADKVWTADQSTSVDHLRRLLRASPALNDEELFPCVATEISSISIAAFRDAWKKLQAFPHIFEVAAARGHLMDCDLSGKHKHRAITTLQHLTYRRWKVHLPDFDA